MAKTDKPTGLSITRNGNSFTCKWKIGDKDYGNGQQFQYRYGKGKWRSVSIGTATKSKTISISPTSYYPYKGKKTLSSIAFRVRGNRKAYTTGSGKKEKKHNPTWSDWSAKTMTFKVPAAPSVSAALDDSKANVTTFSWSTSTSKTNTHHYTNNYWQSMLLKNNGETNGDKLNWSTASRNKGYMTNSWLAATANASGSRVIKEETDYLATPDSYTRWFRIWSRGVKGRSAYKYAKHVYAKPNRATIRRTEASENESGGTQCTVEWVAASNSQFPIDYTTVQYAMAVPNEGMECPTGASWEDTPLSADTAGTDAAVFAIDDVIGTDECLFVRVNTTHDFYTTYGIPANVTTGLLADPVIDDIQIDDDTYRATISATNNSDYGNDDTNPSDLFIAVYYKTKTDPDEEFVVGIIRGQKNQSHSITVQCPDWSESSGFSFGLRAIVGRFVDQGEYKLSTDITVDTTKGYYVRTGAGTADDPFFYTMIETPTGNPTAQGWYEKSEVSSYSITEELMTSKAVTWDRGEVPLPPANVQVSAARNKGTVLVTWDNTWKEADHIELSWADHDDAWESTDEPSSYTVSNIHASRWNISGLETGKAWWIRVRLAKGSGEDAVYGPWSPIADGMISLTSAPNVPVLQLSDKIITEAGSVTASWGYSTTDGTRQARAEICECDITEDGIEYGSYKPTQDMTVTEGKAYYDENRQQVTPSAGDNPQAEGWYEFKEYIAHVDTAQHITLNAQELGWTAGNLYNLAVRVQSASGVMSDRWSDPVSLQVALPLECEISSTSLVPTAVPDPDGTTVDTVTVGVLPAEIASLIIDVDVFVEWEENPYDTWTFTAVIADGEATYQLDGITIDPAEAGITPTIVEDTADGSYSVDFTVSAEPLTDEVNMLTVLPLTMTVEGAGEGGTTSVAIERREAYRMMRPDENMFAGSEGETVALKTQIGEGTIEIDADDLIGAVDDGAKYRIVATIQDGLGQSDSATVDFEVGWAHQAVIPEAAAEMDEYATLITPIAPDGVTAGDVADIYRLSADKPQLIVKGAEWGETYVDPYPAIGTSGGHRVVCRTINNDYITAEQQAAWVDLGEDEGDLLDVKFAIIDFDGDRVELQYNVDVNNSWSKDFIETQYLGGSVQGDWNAAVSRTGSVNAVTLPLTEQDTIDALRRLSVYAGICHVRTADGSSFAADVQVSEERSHDDYGAIVEFSLSITRVDPEGFEGVTLEQWQEGESE